MKSENPLQQKSYAFAIRIVTLCQAIQNDKHEWTLSKQLLRAGTSIGANVEEAIGAQSEKDFYAKLCIVYKEARETHYWLRLLRDTNYLTFEQASSTIAEIDELLKITGSILKTLKQKLANS